MMKEQIKKYWFVLALLFSTTAVSIIAYHAMNPDNSVQDIHKSYIDKTINFPFRYRILVPFTIEYARMITGLPIKLLYDAFTFIFLWMSLALFFFFLKKFLSDTESLLGVLLMNSLYCASYNLFQPCDIIVLFIAVVSSLIIVNKLDDMRYNLLLLAMLFIGTFNKETTFFIALTYAIFKVDSYLKTKKASELILAAASFISCIIPYLLLRIFLGLGGERGGYEFMLFNNFTQPIQLLSAAAFFGVILFLAVKDFNAKPKDLCLMFASGIVYMIVNLFIGLYGELRLFIPVMVFLIPMFLLQVRSEMSK